MLSAIYRSSWQSGRAFADSKLHVRVITADQPKERAVADALGFVSFPSIELIIVRLMRVFSIHVFASSSCFDGPTRWVYKARERDSRDLAHPIQDSSVHIFFASTHAKWHLEIEKAANHQMRWKNVSIVLFTERPTDKTNCRFFLVQSKLYQERNESIVLLCLSSESLSKKMSVEPMPHGGICRSPCANAAPEESAQGCIIPRQWVRGEPYSFSRKNTDWRSRRVALHHRCS